MRLSRVLGLGLGLGLGPWLGMGLGVEPSSGYGGPLHLIAHVAIEMTLP